MTIQEEEKDLEELRKPLSPPSTIKSSRGRRDVITSNYDYDDDDDDASDIAIIDSEEDPNNKSGNNSSIKTPTKQQWEVIGNEHQHHVSSTTKPKSNATSQSHDDLNYSWSIIKRKLIILIGLLIIFSFTIWYLHPYQRIINFLLPPWNTTDIIVHADQQSTSSSSAHTNKNEKNLTKQVTFQFDQCNTSNNTTTESSNKFCCNGLTNICHLQINQIMFATMHNAMSTKEDGSFLQPNHAYSFEKALQAGYRGFHFKLCKCNDGVYKFCRNICYLGTCNPTDVLLRMNRFLQDHPYEILLIHIEIVATFNEYMDNQPISHLHEFYQYYMKNTTTFHQNLYYKDYPSQNWPTLQTMINQDRVCTNFIYFICVCCQFFLMYFLVSHTHVPFSFPLLYFCHLLESTIVSFQWTNM